jgi:hypothetical protein
VTSPASPCSTNSAIGELRGSVVPRLWTPPLRELTPETSYGFELNEFAVDIDESFDPWQEWLSIHLGELNEDGTPRFRTTLVLVSRQQGKTRFAKVWSLWNLFIDMAVPGRYELPTLLGLSSKLDYAKETWAAAVATARRCPELAAEVPRNGVRESNGEQYLATTHGTRYKIAASNEDAGRSLTVHRLMVDELRRLKDFIAWDAAEPTTTAVHDAQILCLSNQGDDSAVVLDSLRGPALAHIENGQGDPTLGLFEWSAPDGSDPTDVQALLQANPNVGYRVPLQPLLNRARRAKEAGGKLLAGFKTEALCMRVPVLDPAIDADAWKLGDVPGTMDGLRDRVALVLDVSLDLDHAMLIAAAQDDTGQIRLEAVAAWSGRGCLKAVRRDLPGHVQRVRPRALGWFPTGPAAALLTDLRDPKNGRQAWRPRSVVLTELREETPAVCMAFSELVLARDVAHSGDDLLTQHVLAAQKLHIANRWVFSRPGTTPVNGAYAAAGAAHLARFLPPPIGKPRLLVAK